MDEKCAHRYKRKASSGYWNCDRCDDTQPTEELVNIISKDAELIRVMLNLLSAHGLTVIFPIHEPCPCGGGTAGSEFPCACEVHPNNKMHLTPSNGASD